MDDIALELEATKGLLYHHFRSKQEILKTILEVHPLPAAIEFLEPSTQTQDLYGALSDAALQSLRTMRQHRAFISFLFVQAQSSREQAEVVFRQVLDRWTAAFRSIIEAHLPDASRSRTGRLAQQIVDVILSSFIRNELAGQSNEDPENYVLDALEIIVNGVRATESEKP